MTILHYNNYITALLEHAIIIFYSYFTLVIQRNLTVTENIWFCFSVTFFG